jgi:hypothetical protein
VREWFDFQAELHGADLQDQGEQNQKQQQDDDRDAAVAAARSGKGHRFSLTSEELEPESSKATE